jgi:hypothetical protein
MDQLIQLITQNKKEIYILHILNLMILIKHKKHNIESLWHIALKLNNQIIKIYNKDNNILNCFKP